MSEGDAGSVKGRLKAAAGTGLDMSPGDALSAEALATIERLERDRPAWPCQSTYLGFHCTRVMSHPGNHRARGLNGATIREWTGGDVQSEQALDSALVEKVKETSGGDWDVFADKELRKQLDGLYQRLKALPASEERQEAGKKLREAVMWLGLDLKRLGMDDLTNSVIDKPADGLTF